MSAADPTFADTHAPESNRIAETCPVWWERPSIELDGSLSTIDLHVGKQHELHRWRFDDHPHGRFAYQLLVEMPGPNWFKLGVWCATDLERLMFCFRPADDYQAIEISPKEARSIFVRCKVEPPSSTKPPTDTTPVTTLRRAKQSALEVNADTDLPDHIPTRLDPAAPATPPPTDPADPDWGKFLAHHRDLHWKHLEALIELKTVDPKAVIDRRKVVDKALTGNEDSDCNAKSFRMLDTLGLITSVKKAGCAPTQLGHAVLRHHKAAKAGNSLH